jgi:ABC-type transport system substrate-binding protein
MPRPAKSPSPNSRFGFFFASLLLYFLASFSLSGCSRTAPPDPSSLTLIIESNPTNLDPRFATDAQSQHIDGLLEPAPANKQLPS